MRTFLLPLALVIDLMICPALAKETIYRDPRQPSFTLLVPDGWSAAKTDQGVEIRHDRTAVVMLVVQTESVDPSNLIAEAPQLEKREGFHLIEKGGCVFGSQNGAYIIYSLKRTDGPTLITKEVMMTTGHLTYTMFEQSHADKYDDEKSDMERIQKSFSPETVDKAAENPEKLDALHAAGVISDEDYESGKRGETIFRDQREPSYKVTVPRGWNALKIDTGVKLEKQPGGTGLVQLWIVEGASEPSAMIARLSRQIAKQWRTFRSVEEGECRFGGEKGAYGVYTGEDKGGPLTEKLVTTTDGKWTYTMMMVADADQYDAVRKEMDHIQQSFALEVASSSSGKKPN